ncbi:Protein of unknown function [Bacillus wiedmannii]|uniref:Uncharacterized protein n=1 Tax=Bacillus wiedmannii TaxID=1890302 RepID=A0A1C4DDP6_9BACI|nr:Protein of unknown function [Bacillus wiedmannii]SCL96791.1 Protein of unknown function [Bacillus wiedmannii]
MMIPWDKRVYIVLR